MTNQKNHNPILFLTTLGVYLGLVLVGSTPVLGHAALTRNFDVRDEIEVEDDLDNKPEDERSSLSDSIGTYLEDVENFLRNLRKLSQSGKFDLEKDSFGVSQATLLPCVAGNKVGSYTALEFAAENESLKPSLGRLSKDLSYGYSLGDCLPNDRFKDVEATDSRFSFGLNGSEFSVRVIVKKTSPQSALHLLGPLQQTLTAFGSKEINAIRTAVLQNTSFKSENDQVFIVTRLPRASIDPLLAKDAE